MLSSVTKVAGDVSSYLEGMVRKLAMESVGGGTGGLPAFPRRVGIGCVDRREMASYAAGIARTVSDFEQACLSCGARLERSAFTLPDGRHVPSNIVFATKEQAVGFCAGTEWSGHVEVALEAVAELAGRLEALCALRPELRRELTIRFALFVQEMHDSDFSLYVDAVAWLLDNDERGMAVRQVPLRGFSRRWVAEFGRGLERVVGRELAFTDMPRRVDFSYLDPAHAASGGQRHGSYVEGDVCSMPYPVRSVIVVGDEEDMLYFPDVPGGVCVFCPSAAVAGAVADLPWVASCDRVLYWGNMDEQSFRVLDALRTSGLSQVTSTCMAPDDYRGNLDLGECHDDAGKYISRISESDALAAVAEMRGLDDDERATCLLCMSTGPVRRICQSRLPFPDIVL